MICLDITDARIKEDSSNPGRWIVLHPCNDAILASCDTLAEATMVRECINDLPRIMREVGVTHKGSSAKVR